MIDIQCNLFDHLPTAITILEILIFRHTGRRSSPYCRNGALLYGSLYVLLTLVRVSAAGKDNLPMV